VNSVTVAVQPVNLSLVVFVNEFFALVGSGEALINVVAVTLENWVRIGSLARMAQSGAALVLVVLAAFVFWADAFPPPKPSEWHLCGKFGSLGFKCFCISRVRCGRVLGSGIFLEFPMRRPISFVREAIA